MPEQVKHLVDRIDACDAPKKAVSHLLRLLFPPGYKRSDASGYVAADVFNMAQRTAGGTCLIF